MHATEHMPCPAGRTVHHLCHLVNRSWSRKTYFRLTPFPIVDHFLSSSKAHSADLSCMPADQRSMELQRRIQATEMRCYRKIQCISYKDHVTNEEVRAKIQQAIGPQEDPLTTVRRRKLQWYGHVSRSSGLAKTILQGTVKEGRRQGRQT